MLAPPTATVFGLSATGLAIARILGRRGIRVYGVDRRHWEIGRSSRYVEVKSTLRAALTESGEDSPVFVGGDPELRAYCEVQSADAGAKKSSELALALLDKGSQFRRCEPHMNDLGMAMPRTWSPVVWQDWADIPSSLSLVLKPRFGGASRLRPRFGKLWQCLPGQSPMQYAKELGLDADAVLVQEVIPGPDTSIDVCFLYRYPTGEFGSIMTGQKLRQQPRGFGSSSRLVTTDDPELATMAKALITRLGVTGLVSLEWKRHAAQRFLMEINPRAVLFSAIAPEVILDAYAGAARLPVRSPTHVPGGRRWQYSIREPFSAPVAGTVDALATPDDPWPGRLALPYTLALMLATRVRGRHIP